ncbi:hypothetical protein CBL_06138 [Carabus blaptoides fortunei]
MTKKRALGLNAASIPSTFNKSHRNANGNKIRRMLAAMEHQANQATGQSDGSTKSNPDGEKFFSSGRTGRRNALPDILGEHARVTSSDLPARLQALTTTESSKMNMSEAEPGPSRQTSEQN